MFPGCSLKITVRQTELSALGCTHASSVIPDVRSSEFESGTVTLSFTPSNDMALPCLPPALQRAPEMVPLFPDPDASATVEPVPSSKLYAATSPDGGGGGALLSTVTLTSPEVGVSPAVSVATAVSV